MKKFEQRELIKKNKTKRINKSSIRRNKKFSTIVFKFVDVFIQSFSIIAIITFNIITSTFITTSIFITSLFSTNITFTTSIIITSISAKKKRSKKIA